MRQFLRQFAPVFCATLLVSSNLSIQFAVGQLQMRGTDISALPVFESAGAAYAENGVSGNALDILESNGVNWHRLRVFVSPTGSDPFVVQDLNYSISLAQRAKANGASLLLDLHYSDTWADPGQQIKPSAWTGLSFNQLEQRVYDYTKDVIEQFDMAGVLPEMVQIGNEIGNGVLWEDGRLWRSGVSESTEFNNLATLLSAGIRGARDGAGIGSEPGIMIHHANGADWGTTSYYFDRLLPRLIANGTDIDAIGYSYYPKFHYNPANGAGDIADVQQNLNNTAATYNKPVVIVEAGFASRGAQFEPSYEFPVSPAGQKDYLQAVVEAVKAVPNNMGQGVFWWYPEAVPTGGLNVWEGGRYGLFDEIGNLNPAIEVFETNAGPSAPVNQFSISFTNNANSSPGSTGEPGIYGQGFSPSLNPMPDPGLSNSENVQLDRFTFFKDSRTDFATNIKLAIFDDFNLNLTSLNTNRVEFVGISNNTIASTSTLAVGTQYSFDFSGLNLQYDSDYLALFVNEDELGNLTPIKVSALTADYVETIPGSGVWVPISNYGTHSEPQYAVSNWISPSGTLTAFTYAADAKFQALFDYKIPGDFDANGVVNWNDLTEWQSDYGTNGNSDADGDGDSDGYDFLIWQRNYDGLPNPLSNAFRVPEPFSISCFINAAITVLVSLRGTRLQHLDNH